MPQFPPSPASPQPPRHPGLPTDTDPFGDAGFVEPQPLSGAPAFAWPQPVAAAPVNQPPASQPPAPPLVPTALPEVPAPVGNRFRMDFGLDERKKVWMIRLGVTAALLLVGFLLYQADLLSVSVDQSATGELADQPPPDEFAPELSQAGPLNLLEQGTPATYASEPDLDSIFQQSEPPTHTIPVTRPPHPGELTITPGPSRPKPGDPYSRQVRATQTPDRNAAFVPASDIHQISSELPTGPEQPSNIQQPLYQQTTPGEPTTQATQPAPEYPIYSGNRPPAASPAASATQQLEAEMEKIDQLLQQGDTINAHRLASRLYWTQPAHRDMLEEIINLTSLKIYFLPQPLFIAPRTVRPGDNLESIAREYQVPWQYLARLNRIGDPLAIQPGQQLKVNRGPFAAVIDLGRHELTIHANNYYVRRFRIGIGREHGVPLGQFTVGYKKPYESYTDPRTGEVVAGGDPRNPLGTHFLQLYQNGQATKFSLHGTSEPDSIGQDAAAGCIRLNNKEIAVLFDLLDAGSPVIVRP